MLREQMLKDQESNDLELFEKIKNKSKPDILDLWALSEDRFIEWRRLNDFPVLLAHFDKTLLLFKEWKTDNKLTNEIIIKSGEITPFLENKKLSKKDKTLYLTKQTWNDKENTFVGDVKTEGIRKEFDTTYNFELIQSFTSYLDWLKAKDKYQEILKISLRIATNHKMERVFIHADIYASESDFELLKMGGIPLPVNNFRTLCRGKRMEFVNLCGLVLTGDIRFGELGNLSCSYCACDNWIAKDFNMPQVTLEHCTITNFTLENSKLQQWLFYDCHVSGDFFNSKLYKVNIFGGNFSPVTQNCTLSDTHIKIDPNIVNNNFYGYKSFKKIYQTQGDDELTKFYFIQENEFIRKGLKGWSFFTKTLSYYYWEYGRKPHRIIYLSLAIIILFGFIYWLNSDLIALNSSKIKEFNFGDGFPPAP
jgi:uncharacterized protein YjbI with pentapeptide repeats